MNSLGYISPWNWLVVSYRHHKRDRVWVPRSNLERFAVLTACRKKRLRPSIMRHRIPRAFLFGLWRPRYGEVSVIFPQPICNSEDPFERIRCEKSSYITLHWMRVEAIEEVALELHFYSGVSYFSIEGDRLACYICSNEFYTRAKELDQHATTNLRLRSSQFPLTPRVNITIHPWDYYLSGKEIYFK